MKTSNLITFIDFVISDYQESSQPSAARVCRAMQKKLVAFLGGESMDFNQLSHNWLQSFQSHLENELMSNSVSTYMRMLQTVYNKAVDKEIAFFIPRLFNKVAKGRRYGNSRALPHQAFRRVALVSSKTLGRLTPTRDLFLLMFCLRGLPFVDLIYLRRRDLHGNRLTYRRRKTGKTIVVIVNSYAMTIIEKYKNTDIESPYLFPFLSLKDGSVYQQYATALSRFNRDLQLIAELLELDGISLTSYCARHSWASYANYCKYDKKMISEGMGHSTLLVTETYFKPYEEVEIEKMNEGVISYAFDSGGKGVYF